MEKITVTQNGRDDAYALYVYEKVKERFSFLPASFQILPEGDRTKVEFSSEERYCPYIRKITQRCIADVLALGYKYCFFEKKLPLPLLNEQEKKLLLTALTAADYREDYAYIFSKLKGFEEYAIDGVYNFRLSDLKARWTDVMKYISPDFCGAYLESFISFLIDEGEGRAYYKDGKVYDEEYRVLEKSKLIGGYSPVRELVLSGVKEVYCYSSPDRETKTFLEKYYKENAVFY